MNAFGKLQGTQGALREAHNMQNLEKWKEEAEERQKIKQIKHPGSRAVVGLGETK